MLEPRSDMPAFAQTLGKKYATWLKSKDDRIFKVSMVFNKLLSHSLDGNIQELITKYLESVHSKSKYI